MRMCWVCFLHSSKWLVCHDEIAAWQAFLWLLYRPFCRCTVPKIQRGWPGDTVVRSLYCLAFFCSKSWG